MQHVVDARLPAAACCAQGGHNVRIKPQFDRYFGIFFNRSNGAAAFAGCDLLGGVNSRKFARLGLFLKSWGFDDCNMFLLYTQKNKKQA